MIRSVACALLASLPLGENFPVFVWCQDHAGTELPAPLLEAFGGVNIEGADSARWALEEKVDFYVGHAPGRETLHLQRDVEWYDKMWSEFYRTRDTTRLVRMPCLSDPATWNSSRATLDKTLAARGGKHGHAVSLGDEVGLTPWGDPLDLCQSEACTERWVAWQRERGSVGSDEELAQWPTTDDVRLAYLDGATEPVAAWLERRRFHQDVVLGFLKRLAAHARNEKASLPIALFGLTGQTAFGGVSIPSLLPHLDVVEAYNEGCARELLFSLRTSQTAWCTIFPAKGDSDRGAHRLWEHWLRGGDGAIVWSDRELQKEPRYLKRLAQAVHDVRAVHGSFPEWRPKPSRIALLHDSDSTALAWLRDALSDGATWPKRFAGYQAEHGTREVAVNGSLRLFEDCGFLPGAIPLNGLDAEAALQFPWLVAVHQLVVTEDGEARLVAFLEGGGKLLIRGPFGILGDHAVGAEGRLRKRFPEQVTRLQTDDSGEFDYLGARVSARDGRVAAQRKELTELLDKTRDWSVTSTPQVPLLIAEQRLPDGSRLCAVLPNLPSGTIPAVELKLTAEAEVTRIFPNEELPGESSQVQLAPGNAYVFLLR